MCTNAIPLRRSSLRYRPSAPPDARAYGLSLRYGAAQRNRCRGSAPRPPSTSRANKSCHASCCRPLPKNGIRCSASGNNRGGCAPAALLNTRSLPLTSARRGAWKVEEKVRVPAAMPSAWTAQAALKHRPGREAPVERNELIRSLHRKRKGGANDSCSDRRSITSGSRRLRRMHGDTQLQ